MLPTASWIAFASDVMSGCHVFYSITHHDVIPYVIVSVCRFWASSRAKYHVVVAALTCCFSCLSCAAMHIVE